MTNNKNWSSVSKNQEVQSFLKINSKAAFALAQLLCASE